MVVSIMVKPTAKEQTSPVVTSVTDVCVSMTRVLSDAPHTLVSTMETVTL